MLGEILQFKMPIITTKPDSIEVLERYHKYPTKNSPYSFQENMGLDDEKDEFESSDSAICIVDLDKIKKQYEIWHDSFGGNQYQ